MEIKTTEKEKQVLERMAKSSDGKVLLGYLQKVIDALADVRTLAKEESKESRIIAITFLEDAIINRFKILKGNLEEEDTEQDFM